MQHVVQDGKEAKYIYLLFAQNQLNLLTNFTVRIVRGIFSDLWIMLEPVYESRFYN